MSGHSKMIPGSVPGSLFLEFQSNDLLTAGNPHDLEGSTAWPPVASGFSLVLFYWTDLIYCVITTVTSFTDAKLPAARQLQHSAWGCRRDASNNFKSGWHVAHASVWNAKEFASPFSLLGVSALSETNGACEARLGWGRSGDCWRRTGVLRPEFATRFPYEAVTDNVAFLTTQRVNQCETARICTSDPFLAPIASPSFFTFPSPQTPMFLQKHSQLFWAFFFFF